MVMDPPNTEITEAGNGATDIMDRQASLYINTVNSEKRAAILYNELLLIELVLGVRDHAPRPTLKRFSNVCLAVTGTTFSFSLAVLLLIWLLIN